MNDTRGLRIGDAEREAAVSALGEHYAAGRLTKDEFDERSSQVWAATLQRDVDPLFGDLPGEPRAARANTAAPTVAEWRMPPQHGNWHGNQHGNWHGDRRAGWQPGVRPGRRPPLLALPFVLLAVGAVVTMAVLIGPWILFGLFWLAVFSGCGGRRTWDRRPAGARPRS